MIQKYKIIRGIDNVDASIWFQMVGDLNLRLTRNTAYRTNLVASRCRTDLRRNFFSNRIVSTWNALPQDIKKSKSLNIFRHKLEEITL